MGFSTDLPVKETCTNLPVRTFSFRSDSLTWPSSWFPGWRWPSGTSSPLHVTVCSGRSTEKQRDTIITIHRYRADFMWQLKSQYCKTRQLPWKRDITFTQHKCEASPTAHIAAVTAQTTRGVFDICLKYPKCQTAQQGQTTEIPLTLSSAPGQAVSERLWDWTWPCCQFCELVVTQQVMLGLAVRDSNLKLITQHQ